MAQVQMSKTEQEIAKHMAEIARLKESGLEQDIRDVLAKKHTEEDLEVACRAFLKHVDYKKRVANLDKARKEKETKPPA